MKLIHIKEEKCPICGAIITEEITHNKHTNGLWNERRKFKCGHILAFSANGRQVRTSKHCPNNPVVIKEKEKAQKAIEKAIKFFERIDVDILFKEEMINAAKSKLWRH